MINIAERPAEVEDRAVPGHWEGDLIIGKQNDSAIGTLVARQPATRCCVHAARWVTRPSRSATHWPRRSRPCPKQLRRSLTWDQGVEMRDWKQVQVAADIAIYFCDPHSPWQRAHQREHQRAAAAVLPEGHRPVGATPKPTSTPSPTNSTTDPANAYRSRSRSR